MRNIPPVDTIGQLRTQFNGPPAIGQRLRQYHLSEQEIAGLLATETAHPAGFKIPRHAHNLASFYLTLAGSFTEFFSQARHERRPYNVVFTPAGEVHSNTFHDAGGRCFLVELSASWSNRLTASGISLNSTFDAHGGEVARLATSLYKEFRYADKVSPLSVEGLGLEILAAFSRNSESGSAPQMPSWLRMAKELLHDRFAETLTLDEIAGEVRVHPVHLARTFRKRFRCSVGEYQRRLRVEHAAHQLTITELTIAEIALAAGLSDQAHFSRVFKTHKGLTPGKFRLQFSQS